MRQKDPKVTHFNQKEEIGTNPDLEELIKLKSSLDQKKKSARLKLQEEVQSTNYSNDLITDLEHNHSNLQTKQKDHPHSPIEENQTQNLKNLKKSSKQCEVQTSDSQSHVNNKTLTSNKKDKKQGQANPNGQKDCYRKHATIYTDNPRMTRDYPEGNLCVHSETCDCLCRQPACTAKNF